MGAKKILVWKIYGAIPWLAGGCWWAFIGIVMGQALAFSPSDECTAIECERSGSVQRSGKEHGI